MKKQYLNPKELNTPRFYTHAITVQGGSKVIYVSGQVSYDRDGVVFGKGDLRAQCEQVFKNLTHILRAAGAGWDDVVKINGYMVGMHPEAVDIYRGVRSRYLKADKLPASTLVGVERLVHEDLLLEVEIVAAVPEKKPAKKKR
jgi:enamine deaminase RidA (YjgF/YER057c/UK114 family)